ncbi:MAG TPA: hypothetical protein VM580_20180 [Labilithrix sp.]|nr:hypothetical protein [Labilithrix sp.]
MNMKTNEKKSVKVEMNAEELKAVSGGAVNPDAFQTATAANSAAYAASLATKLFPGDLRHW